MRVVDYRRGLLLGPAPPQGGDRKSESYQNPSVDFDLPDAAKRRYRLIVESWDWIVYPWLSEHNEWMVSPLLTFVVDDESCRGHIILRCCRASQKWLIHGSTPPRRMGGAGKNFARLSRWTC